MSLSYRDRIVRHCFGDKVLEPYLDVRLDCDNVQIFPVKNGVDYLGFHAYLTETGKVIRKIRKKSKAAMKRKIKKFNVGYSEQTISYDKICRSIASWMGHAKHGNTYYLRKNIIKRLKLRK